MKYTPPYRIETGGIYEYDAESNAYVHIYRKSQLSKDELNAIKRQIAVYEANYDKWKREQI